MSPLRESSDLPSGMAIRNMLEDMLGRDIKISPGDAWAPTLNDPGVVAVYVNDRFQATAYICCDMGLSVALSASIALIPVKTAEECVREQALFGEMAENLNEVLNIMAALFNSPNAPHVKLDGSHLPGELPPADLSAQLRFFGNREDFTIDVAGYGSGSLSLVLV